MYFCKDILCICKCCIVSFHYRCHYPVCVYSVCKSQCVFQYICGNFLCFFFYNGCYFCHCFSSAFGRNRDISDTVYCVVSVFIHLTCFDIFFIPVYLYIFHLSCCQVKALDCIRKIRCFALFCHYTDIALQNILCKRIVPNFKGCV